MRTVAGSKIALCIADFLRFDSVAKASECTDPLSAGPDGLFVHRGATLLTANTGMQNDPDQLTESMHNRPDGLVMSRARHETTVDGLEDGTPYTFVSSLDGILVHRRATARCYLRLSNGWSGSSEPTLDVRKM